jgi:RND superfamily putative drug exporter
MRLTLVPSLLALLGERTWAIPRWLESLLPGITIEPPGERPQAPPPLPRPETAPAEGAP